MNKFRKIKKVIQDYQKKSDKLFESYKAAETSAREKYSAEGFRTEFIQKDWVKFAAEAQSNADIAVIELNNMFGEIRDDLSSWMMRPLDPSVVQVLNCVGQFGLSLSIDELRVIESNIRESYLGMRIFEGLAEKNGYGVTAPKMKQHIDSLESARGNAEVSVRAYAGHAEDGFPGRDLLSEWRYNNVSYGEYQDYHLVMAELFLQEGGELDHLEQLFERTNAPMAYTLNAPETEKMIKSLESIIDKNGEVDEKAACQLKESDPDFIDKLRSIPEGAFEKVDLASKYYRLDDEGDGKKPESVLSTAVQHAAEYESRQLKPIDKAKLEQFS